MYIFNKDILNCDDDIADGTIDLILTDPPYNISTNGAKPVWNDPVTGENKNTIHSQKFSETFEENWDDVSKEEYIEQLKKWSVFWYKKLRDGGSFAIFISDRYLSYLIESMESAGLEPKRTITWKKPAAVPFNRGVNFVSGCEYIVWGVKKPKKTKKRCFNSDTEPGSIIDNFCKAEKAANILYKHIINGTKNPHDAAKKEYEAKIKSIKTKNNKLQHVVFNSIVYSGGEGNRIHPTQKPTKILEYLICLCTDKKDVVLDTFAGSGSTAIACRNVGRECILIEKDKNMFAKMLENIKQCK